MATLKFDELTADQVEDIREAAGAFYRQVENAYNEFQESLNFD